jgi:hypothetical protein
MIVVSWDADVILALPSQFFRVAVELDSLEQWGRGNCELVKAFGLDLNAIFCIL